MKKSIFLFFAAILCAMSVNAKVIYLNAGGSSLWDQAGAVFTAKVSETEYPMTKIFGSYYEGTVPDDATKVTFMRNAPAGGNWNQTSQLTIPTDGKNCYNITQWSSGNWSTYPPTFYIAGDFVTPTWSENAAANTMDYADGVYSKSYDNVAASAHQFKITNGTWSNAIGYDENTCSGTNCTVGDGGGNIKFTPLVEGTVTITYTIADGKVHITCPEPPAAEFNITYPATETNYTLVAGPAKAQTGAEVSFTATPAEGYVLNVTYNGNAITGNNNVYTFMMPAADVTIAITAVAATTLYYVDNSNWGNANAYMWNDHGNNSWPGAAMALVGTVGDDTYSYYSISFAQGAYTSIIFNNGSGSQTDDLTINTAKPYFYAGEWYTWDDLLAKLATPVVDVYTVVGSSAELGLEWNPAKEANDMEKQDDGSYKKVYSNVELTANVEWKIAKNDDWWNGPTFNVNNNTLPIAKSGIYNVTFTLSADLETANATADFSKKPIKWPCFISGNAALTGGAGWAGNEFQMEYTEATETYTYTFTGLAAATSYELKVVIGGAWHGFADLVNPAPANVTAGNDGAIAFTLTEAGDVTVTYNVENGINLTGNFAAPVTYDYYIAGTLAGGWNATQQGMIKDGDLYKAIFSELPANTYQFKITDGQWNTDDDKTHEFTTLGAAYAEVSIVEGNVQIVTEEAKNITVIFDATADEITFEGLTEKAPVEKHYYLIGSFNEWTKADATNELVLDGEVYKKEVTFAQDVEFKVNDGADAWWGFANLGGKTYAEVIEGNDANLKMKEEKTFTVIFDPANNLITFEDLTVVEDYYTIVGATAITGANWDPANEANKMAKDGEAYTLTKTGLKLEAGDYEYKVAKNGKWGDGEYPNGTNEKVTIAENGEYTIVYTYTVGTSLEAVATKTGEYAPDQAVYTVAGDAALCGNNWQADDVTNDMTANGDGTFTWTKTGVVLTGNVGFKVVKNHDYGNGAYPANDWVINIADYDGAAIYTVTITFTESSKEIAVTLTKTGEATPPVITYVLMGVNNDWTTGIALTQNPDNADEYVLENQVIIKATDAVKVVTLTDGTATAWCGNVDSYSNATYTGGGEDNIVLEDGIYTFYFKKTANNIYINQTGYARTATPGSFSTICLPYAGTISGATLFNLTDRDANYVYVVEAGIELEAGKPYVILPTEDKIIVTYKNSDRVDAGKNGALCGTYEEMNANQLNGKYVITGNKYYYVDEVQSAGSKLLAYRAYFNLNDLPTVPASAPGVRRIALGTNGQNTATGMENVDASAQPVKTIINGQLFILRGEKMYDAQGKLVK